LLQAIWKLALRAQTVQIADLPLRQDLLAKDVLMTAQRNFCLGNTLLRAYPDFLRCYPPGLKELKSLIFRFTKIH
jgi:hypothetical protein